MIKAGVIGATGYAGQELVKRLSIHREVEIIFLCSNSHHGKMFSDVYPHFKSYIDVELVSTEEAIKRFMDIDILFTALPHGTSFEFVQKATNSGIKVVDLGADFRLNDKDLFEQWYKTPHKADHLLEKAVYGLPELWKDSIKTAQIVANPGCYTTASILALAPALKYQIIDPYSIVIDAKSGVTGAGRKADLSLILPECSESVKAYSIASHRHTPEIEQELSKVYTDSIYITFTPHLIPMQRGILATCYANLPMFYSEENVYTMYRDFYKDAPFIRIREDLLETRFVKDSNYCDISIKIDIRTRRLIVTSALDNLVKGASGQAIQNMNIMFGLDEKEGLV